MVKVEVDLSNLSEYGDAMPKIQKRGMELTSLDLINKLMHKSPVDHGLLRQWFISSKSKDKVIIKSPAKYAAFQNYGTSAHMIRPKNKKALHWEGSMNMTFSGDNVSISGSKGGFSKGHMVKGITGKHFVENSIAEVKPRIENHFKVAIKEVLG